MASRLPPVAARVLLLLGACAVAASRPAAALDLLDGRLHVHGYVEEQWRAIARDFDAHDGWDLTQWYNILDVESDLDIAPDGWGPFDLVSGFLRFEARYDCVWTRACGVAQGVNAFGNRARKLPDRLDDARRNGYPGTVFIGDTRRLAGIPVDRLGYDDRLTPQAGKRKPAFLWHFPGVDTLFQITNEAGERPAFDVFGRFVEPGEEYRFGMRRVPSPNGGTDLQALGPWEPRNTIDPLGALANVANPFNPLDFNPNSGAFGVTALPYRPAPLFPASLRAPDGDGAQPRGLFIPNDAVARRIRGHDFDSFDQNFSQAELAWNRGASQQQTKELKEAYLDLELLDSRLWIRAGKQNIVWGKTELFRTTDQFNPQDLALASLPALEESRIALWSLRAVYSFYDIGPLQDVRAELAANFDQFEPNDLGRCGEPYTPNPVCDKAAGLFAHGLAGFGLAGEVRPPDAWDDPQGVELGGRIEFRWRRFSFALSDFWGYDDFPFLDQLAIYERNVDPETGRPRRSGAHGPCTTGDPSIEPACLGPGSDALYHSAANQERFAVICAASVGFNSIDKGVCAQSLFNSADRSLLPFASVSEILGLFLAGSPGSQLLARSQLVQGAPEFPTVFLNQDARDGPPDGFFPDSLGAVTSPEQQALLGCGPHFGTSCDVSTPSRFGGMDLMNAELSVLIQSWAGFPGTVGPFDTGARPAGQSVPLLPIPPGTVRDCAAMPAAPGCAGRTGLVPYAGGAVATRFVNGRLVTIVGARSPFPEVGAVASSGWNAAVDGCVRSSDPGCAGQRELRQPYTGDLFQSELAAFSWNLQTLLVAFSNPNLGNAALLAWPACPLGTPTAARHDCYLDDEFVPTDAYRLNACSYAAPQFCANTQAIYAVAHTTRRSVRAGGNDRYGRTDFDWHQAGAGVLRYEKRNVLGLSADFAEDTFKSNWSIESTWIEGNPFQDNDQFDGLTKADTFNVTISADRPTFINFLNPNRTFFFNMQWFFQYIAGWRSSFASTGPLNVLATLHVDTGYFRDRLTPGLTFVYDFQSASGGVLPEISYHFTDSFSVTLAANLFFGRWQRLTPPLRSVNDLPYRAGRHQDTDWIEYGLSPIRDRDEVALKLRYTF